MPAKGPDVYLFVTIPPDGGWGWIIVFVACLAYGFFDGIALSFGTLIPFLLDPKVFNFSITDVSNIHSVHTGLCYLFGPVVGMLVNKFGFRIVAVAGAAICTLGLLISSFCTNFASFLIFYSIFGGIGSGMVLTSSLLVVGFYFEKYRATAMGIAMTGAGIGTLGFSSLGPKFASLYGIKSTLQLFSLFTGSLVFLCLAYRPLKPKPVAKIKEVDNGTESLTSNDSNDSVEIQTQVLSEMVVAADDTAAMNPSRDEIDEMLYAALKNRSMTSISPSEGKQFDDSEQQNRTFFEKYCCRICVDKTNKILNFNDLKRKRQKKIILTTKPLFRHDITFHGRLNLLPEYSRIKRDPLEAHIMKTDRADQFTSALYALSCTRKKSKTAKCQTFMLLLKMDILTFLSYDIFLVACFFFIFASNVPYLFMTARAIEAKIPLEEAKWIVPSIAISDMIFRVLAGCISFFPNLQPEFISGGMVILTGVSLLLSAFFGSNNIAFQIAQAVIFGSGTAVFSTLKPIILVNCVGLMKLTNAFGVACLVMGIGVMIGTSAAGGLMDLTNSFSLVFLFSGISMILSGAFIICVKFYQKNRPLEE